MQKFSKQMQVDTFFRVCTENVLIKVIVFTTHRGYKCFLNKCRTILYSRYLPKISNKTKLFSLLTVDTNFFLNKCRTDDTLLTVCTKKLLIKVSCFYYSRWTKVFSKQVQNDTLLTAASRHQKTSFEAKLFLVHTVDGNFSKQRRTILYSRYCTKLLLLELSLFYYSRRILFFLNKCRKFLYSSWVLKIVYKN